MNKIINAALLSGLISVAGCTKQLDTKPSESIDASIALQSSSDVKAALVGAFRDFGDVNFFGGRIFLEGDLLADNGEINWSGTYQGMTQINNKSIPVDNGFVTDNWLHGYTAINDANNVLSAISFVTPGDTAEVAGSARFIRGCSYFELVKAFAKAWNDGSPGSNPGVPIVLTPTTSISDASKVSRNTVAEVYSRVTADLTAAEATMPAAAAAMLARVYLQQGDYRNALAASNLAIQNSPDAALTSSYADAFVAGNTIEDIFAIQVTPTSGVQGFNEFYSSSQRGDIQINPAHLDLYESGDSRLDLFYEDAGSTYTGKFEAYQGNVHTIRLAELYLTRAECNFRLGTAVGAAPVDDINIIRERASLPDYAEGTLTLNNILKERKLELAFEGFSLGDVKRLQLSVGNLAWNSPKLIFPIPKREIVVNSNLTQNEGY